MKGKNGKPLPAKATFRKGKPARVKVAGIVGETVVFRHAALRQDSNAEVARVLGELPASGVTYHLQIGDHEYHSQRRDDIAPTVRKWMADYPKSNRKHYWGLWLAGVKAFKREGQLSVPEFRERQKAESKAKRKETKKAIRAKERAAAKAEARTNLRLAKQHHLDADTIDKLRAELAKLKDHRKHGTKTSKKNRGNRR